MGTHHGILWQAFYASRTSSVLTLLRLRSALATGGALHVMSDLDDTEGLAIFTACDALLGEENDTSRAVLSGLLSGEGELQGVSCELSHNNKVRGATNPCLR